MAISAQIDTFVNLSDVANSEASGNAAAVAQLGNLQGTKRKRKEHLVDEQRHPHSPSATSLSPAYAVPPAGVKCLMSTDDIR